MRRGLTGMAAATIAALAGPAVAHPFNVFARSDCVTLTVMASINDGDAPSEGAVTLLNGENVVILTTELVGTTGMVEIPLEGLDLTGGVRAEVVSGGHSDYWVLTPADLSRSCAS